MTIVCCFGGFMIQYVGTRAVAMGGLILLTMGFLLLATSSPTSSMIQLMVGYGLIGGGGNAFYINCFQFATMFENVGLPCSILASLFNVACFNFLLLNIDSISLQAFSTAYAIWGACATVVVFFLFPDEEYKHGDELKMQGWPQCGSGETSEPRNVWQSTKQALSGRRYWAFAVAFAWAALTNQALFVVVNMYIPRFRGMACQYCTHTHIHPWCVAGVPRMPY